MLFFAKSTVYSGSPSGPSSAQVKCLIEERYAQTPQDQAPETTLVNMVLQTQNRRQHHRTIIILSQSGKAQAPHFQVPDPADQQVQPQPPTSSLSPEASPDELEATETSCPPDKPEPEPHPAPPVIILRDETLSSSPPASAPPTCPATTHTPPTMGSKVSKVKEQASNGKLQPSQERLDKEEMKEPDNYYTHRSKSMRRKAGKTGASSGAGGAQGGTAGGAGGAGIA
ncbi:hypothetical protein AALT_g9745 [Alternaria alternata]|nr:hypothetical protein AALT_g9745 [Alternaria alternata]